MSFGSQITAYVNKLFDIIGLKTDSVVSEITASILIFIFFIILGWIVYHVFEHYFTKWALKTKTKLDDEILKNTKKPIYFFVILLGIYFCLEFLSFIRSYSNIFAFIFTVAEILLIAFIVTKVINVLIAWYSEKRPKEKMSEHFLFVIRAIVNAVVFLIAFLLILLVSGFNLSGVVVGLGVTSIVLGFSLQEVLGDFFSAFSIYFDRPFEIGDFIIVGEYSGTVTKITLKSTRIKLLQGEELILSNKELTASSVRNFKKMKKRRINFSFGVTYNTPLEKLEKIPGIIKDIIDPKKLKYVDNLERVHFEAFGDFSLNFDIVYYMKIQDYIKYKDTQQQINFNIIRAFEKEGIEMAFPTQTIYLNKQN